MGNAVRIQPDLQFVKELQSVGGDSLKKCYQCATCSVVCPLSPVSGPYPRKEMVWAQWGLKEKLVNDIDIWLCHHCGQCSDLCPRGARPGDLLAALRNMAYKKLVPPSFLGTWMSSAKFLPLLVAIPAIIYLAIWIIRAGILGTAFPLFVADEHGWKVAEEGGKIIYGGLFPGDYTIDPIFGGVALLVTLAFALGILKLMKAFKDSPKTFVIGYKPPSFLKALIGTITEEVATHNKWKDCGDETAADSQKFKGHFALFYGFVALFIVTSVVAVGHWGGYALEYVLGADNGFTKFVVASGHTPMALWNPVKILANIGAALLLFGLLMLTIRRLNQDESKAKSSFYDWYLLLVIWAVALTGVGSEVLRLAGVVKAAYITYYIHLVTVFMLIAYLPWSKLGHLVYRTVALAYARTTGRLPMGK